MKIFINNDLVNIEILSISTLKDVLKKIENNIPQSHLITKIQLNDKELDSNWGDTSDKIFLLDDDSLTIDSKDGYLIGKETLSSTKPLFEAILKDFQVAADKFRIEDDKKANVHFAQSLQNLHHYFEIISEGFKLMSKDLASLKLKNGTFSQFSEEFSEKQTEIMEIQKSRDWIHLADFIEYEIIPLLEEMKNIG